MRPAHDATCAHVRAKSENEALNLEADRDGSRTVFVHPAVGANTSAGRNHPIEGLRILQANPASERTLGLRVRHPLGVLERDADGCAGKKKGDAKRAQAVARLPTLCSEMGAACDADEVIDAIRW